MEEKTEVIYTKASLGRRMLAHLIDVGIFLFAAIILFTSFNMLMKETGYYQIRINDLVAMRNASGLYVDNEKITTYVKDDSLYPNYSDKKVALSDRIDAFYHNSTYFDNFTDINNKYNERKANAKSGTIYLFEESAENPGEYVEKAVDAKLLYEFYSNEIDNYSLGYLVNNSTFLALTQFSFRCSVVEVIIAAFISFIIFYYILPTTCFKRGRQTIGMKLEKIGLISIRADNITFGTYTLRAVFMFFVFVPLNFVGFLIPSFLSIGMMYFSKTNSSLPNYVFNDYMVDITNQDIYFNDLERAEFQTKAKEASIENQNFKLK